MPDLDSIELEFRSHLHPKSACPPLPLLLAAQEGVLPVEPQEQVSQHLQSCALCSMLLSDLAELPETQFTVDQQERLRPNLSTPTTVVPIQSRRSPSWQPFAAIAAVLVLAVSGILTYRAANSKQPGPSIAVAPAPKPAPTIEVALAKLPAPSDIAPGLVLRGGASSSGGPTFAELLPAFDAYNHDHYDVAARRFTQLTQHYPQSDLPSLYLGISQLFLGQNQNAVATLSHTAQIATPAHRDDVSWYSAIAATRTRNADATALFQQLCQDTHSAYSQQACQVASQLQITGK